MRKIILSLVLILSITGILAGCGGNKSEGGSKKIIVGATQMPHAELLEVAKGDLKAKGIELEIKVFDSYEIINNALAEKQLDANFFQHHPFLESYVKDSGNDLVSIGNVHIEPLGIYSNKINDLSNLAEDAVVTIPNDEQNGGRALHLLNDQGIITLKEDAPRNATLADIAENPKNLKISELEAATLPRTLDDADISVINGNFAIEAGINPLIGALALETSENNPYANIVAVRGEDKDKEELKELYKALTTEKIREYLTREYQGAFIAAF